MYYFDYAASCNTDVEVMNTFQEYELKYFPHPNTYLPSILLREEIKNDVLDLLNCQGKEIVFTSGGTEANNLAILGFAKTLKQQSHFITTTYEHSSVTEPLQEVEKMGHSVTYVTPRKDGKVYAEDVCSEIKDNTVFVSVMVVNNEIGVKNDIELIAKKVKDINSKIIFFSDFVQGLGKIQLTDQSNIDMITISSHKIYGLKSKGALIKNKDVEIEKIFFGGVLENNMRPGSQSIGSEVAFAKAIKLSIDNLDARIAKIKDNVNYLVKTLEQNPKIHLNVMPDTNVVSFLVNSDILAEEIKLKLMAKDVIISTKSACSFAVDKPNASLSCLGLDKHQSDHTIRISVSHHTNFIDIDYLASQISDII